MREWPTTAEGDAAALHAWFNEPAWTTEGRVDRFIADAEMRGTAIDEHPEARRMVELVVEDWARRNKDDTEDIPTREWVWVVKAIRRAVRCHGEVPEWVATRFVWELMDEERARMLPVRSRNTPRLFAGERPEVRT